MMSAGIPWEFFERIGEVLRKYGGLAAYSFQNPCSYTFGCIFTAKTANLSRSVLISAL
jgi:hypothetical protein